MTGPDDASPQAVPSSDQPGPGGTIRTILSGLSWNAGGQLASTVLNIGVTPFLLLHLGVDRYGVYALVSSFRGLLYSLDGGLGPCADRYLAVYAGTADRHKTSSFLFTVSVLVFLVAGIVAAVVGISAPGIVLVLHASTALRASAAQLLRAFMPLLVVTSLRTMLTRIIKAEHRWSYLSATTTASTMAYLGVSVLLVWRGMGLMGMFWAAAAQELVLLVTSMVRVRRSLDRRSFRMMSRSEIREIVRFSSRAQVAEIASTLGNEFNVVAVGLLFPVRFVTYFSVGGNFAGALLSLPMNAISPIAVTLARTFGRADHETTLREFTSLQRLWVRALAAWSPVGAVAAYFGIQKWLGPEERPASLVALVFLAAGSISVLPAVMDAFGKAVNRPGLESRYLGLATGFNMALAVPLALTIGMIGVPIAMGAGQVVSAFYFVHLARREIDPQIRSFFAEIPFLPAALAVGITFLLELPAFLAPLHGAAGLILCGFPAVAGLSVYLMLTVGLRALYQQVRQQLRRPLPAPAPARSPQPVALRDGAPASPADKS